MIRKASIMLARSGIQACTGSTDLLKCGPPGLVPGAGAVADSFSAAQGAVNDILASIALR